MLNIVIVKNFRCLFRLRFSGKSMNLLRDKNTVVAEINYLISFVINCSFSLNNRHLCSQSRNLLTVSRLKFHYITPLVPLLSHISSARHISSHTSTAQSILTVSLSFETQPNIKMNFNQIKIQRHDRLLTGYM